jgi:hypothetical protein
MGEEGDERMPLPLDATPRGIPLAATWARWSCTAAVWVVGVVVVAAGTMAFTHSHRALSSLAWPIGLAWALGSVVSLAMLRAEESRLARELRTARTGTPALRGLIAGRREQLASIARVFSTGLGQAAVLLADGDRAAALDALAGASPIMRGGRLDWLRAVVDADLDRASGTASGVERCMEHLRSMDAIGNREADLYRVHVLVKAILESGDAETGLELAEDLAGSHNDDAGLYVTWLRVWFDLDGGDLESGQLRTATLVARAQGAVALVSKLEARLLTIANHERRE